MIFSDQGSPPSSQYKQAHNRFTSFQSTAQHSHTQSQINYKQLRRSSIEDPKDHLHRKLSDIFLIKDINQARYLTRPIWFRSENKNSANALFKEPPKQDVPELRSRPTKESVAQVDRFMEQIENKKTTLLHFGFRTHEREENRFIKPLVRMVDNENSMGRPTVMVSDMWSNSNINKFLKLQHVNKDLYLMKQLMCRKEKNLQARQMKKSQEINEPSVVMSVYKKMERPNQSCKRRNQNIQHFLTQTQDNLSNLMLSIEEIHEDNTVVHRDINKHIRQISRAFVE